MGTSGNKNSDQSEQNRLPPPYGVTFLAALLRGSDYRICFASPQLRTFTGGRLLLGQPLAKTIPELQGLIPFLDGMREAEHRNKLPALPTCVHAKFHPEWQMEWFIHPLESGEAEEDAFALFAHQLDSTRNVTLGTLYAQDLKRLSEITNSLLAAVDFEGRYRRVGPAYSTLLGWSEWDILAQPVTLIVHPDDRERTQREVERLSEAGKPATFENRLLHKNGSEHWVSWTAAVSQEERLIYAVGREITATRKAEEELRRQSEMNAFRIALADTIRQLDDSAQIQREAGKLLAGYFSVRRVTFATVEGDFVEITYQYNRELPSIPGRLRITDFGEILAAESGRTVVLNNIPKDRRLSDQEKAAYQHIQIASMVAIRLMKKDQIRAVVSIADPRPRTWTEAEVKLMDESAERLWVAVERVAAEAALRKTEERFRLMSRATNDVIWDWNADTDQIEWNTAAIYQFGYAHEELMQTLADWCSRIHPADRARVLESRKRALDSGQETWSEEYRFRKSDGSYAVFLDRGHIARDASGRPHRMIGTMLNLTDRRRVEEALRAANARLAESDRRKDEYLAMLAHELRNPLAAMRNAVELLGTRISESSIPHYLNVLRRQTQSLVRLVDDLLDVARLTRGLVTLRQERVDLAAVTARAVEDVRLSLQQKRHELNVTLPPDSVCVTGDPVRLEQILANLLTNAAKYTDPGGEITITVGTHNSCAEIRVRDTGIGIAPETQERIFGLFSQVEHGIDRAEGGLGIGLTVVKNLVELHHGSIEVHSEGLGRGAEFTVSLPLAPAIEATQRTEQSAEIRAQPTTPKRILVVDDNADIAETLAALLEQSGHEVITANDGPDAVEKSERMHPEVVLLDIGLPGMDGYEVARRLRENPHTHDTVLAALTGYGQESDRDRTEKAGFDAHFVKPVDLDALRSFLESAPALKK